MASIVDVDATKKFARLRRVCHATVSDREHATSSWASSQIGFRFPPPRLSLNKFPIFSFNSNFIYPGIECFSDVGFLNQSNTNIDLIFSPKLISFF